MALTSPGVEVSIIDQSQYLPAPTGSVPFVLVATAQNKADASGAAVAQATTSANANKLYLVTSQRDLVNLYGTPFFYTTTNGTPIQGYELNEYGLLAAYSLLGVTNRCYVLRADIDLASLVGQTGRPTGAPDNGTYWWDTTSSQYGIFEFNATTGTFTQKTPIVITDADQLSSNAPLNSIGNIGDYAVNALFVNASAPTGGNAQEFFYKTTNNTWLKVGRGSWQNDWPTIQGTESDPTLTPGDTFTIGYNGEWTTTITVPVSPNNTVEGVANAINTIYYGVLTASVRSGKLCIFGSDVVSTDPYFTIGTGSGTVLDDLGITTGNYYFPELYYGTAAELPLWTSSQTYPKPTGSVWIKIGSAGNGFNPVISEYSSAAASFISRTVNFAESDWAMNSQLDSEGGLNIPAGTLYAMYDYNGEYDIGPINFYKRVATGPTVVTGTVDNPSFTNGPYTLGVYVSVPGSSSLSSLYTITLADNTDATDFVTAWSSANIPNTTASVTTSGAIQLTHTKGGVIILADNLSGTSNELLTEAGFIINTTENLRYGPSIPVTYTQPGSTSGSGTGAQITVTNWYSVYNTVGDTFAAAGTGYAVGDTITVPGTSLGGTSPANDLVVVVTEVDGSGGVTAVSQRIGGGVANYSKQATNWGVLEYTPNEGAPVQAPANNTNWFYSVTNQVDIMVNYNGAWKGYKNQNYDSNGFPTPTGSNATDPAGPIISASEPTTQSDGTALVYGDLWIDTSDLENYPVIYRWQQVDAEDQWVLIDNTDQTSSTGVAFADARWATSGTTNPADDPIPTITSLLTSNYLDLDAPASSTYPTGMLLFNTRRSGYNVKQYKVNYFNGADFPGETLPTQKDAWVSVSGLQSDGAPYMGRKAQRAMVVEAMRSAIDTNQAIRDEDNFFNLMATPNYPELQPNMIVLNSDRGETGYILGDTPMRLADSATAIANWATNAAGATSTGEEGLVTRSTYMGLFYPSGLAFDLSGNEVAVPASHMMLRTFLRNDTVAYPWLAAAGTRRGIIDNAANIGYLDATTGEFQVIKTRIGIRDTLYENFINPLVFFTGNGLLNYGNKTSFNSQSALDRTNVARLIAYIRRQLTIAGRPFVFEPNDAITRQQFAGVVETLMIDLVAKRGIYDYLVVCDESNNTPARIDRNELWCDVAIEPVKAAEFIYVPVRILNTGELAAL